MKNDIFKNGFGTNGDAVKKAAQSGDTEALLKALSPEQAALLNSVLNDKGKAEKILSSPQAKALYEALGGK